MAPIFLCWFLLVSIDDAETATLISISTFGSKMKSCDTVVSLANTTTVILPVLHTAFYGVFLDDSARNGTLKAKHNDSWIM